MSSLEDLEQLRGHTRVLSALRETQLDHYAEHKADVVEIKSGVVEIKSGLAHIVTLLAGLGGAARTTRRLARSR